MGKNKEDYAWKLLKNVTQKCNTHFITSLARTHWPYLPEGKASGNGGHSQAPRKGKSFVTCLLISATLALEESRVQFTQSLRVFCQHRLSSGLSTRLQRSYIPARPEKLGSQTLLFKCLGSLQTVLCWKPHRILRDTHISAMGFGAPRLPP